MLDSRKEGGISSTGGEQRLFRKEKIEKPLLGIAQI